MGCGRRRSMGSSKERALGGDLEGNVALGHPSEGDARREQLPADDAKAPQVTLVRVALRHEHLGRCPLHRADT